MLSEIWGLVAAGIAIVTAIGIVLGFFWQARAARTETNDLLKGLGTMIAANSAVMEKSLGALERCSTTLDRIEERFNTHDNENIAAHTRMLEAVRK